MTGELRQDRETEKLYIDAEADANAANVRFLAILANIAVLCDILNEVDVFHIELPTMRLSTLIALLVFLLPFGVQQIHDGLLRRPVSILRSDNFKMLVILSSYAGICLLCITMTHHAVILMALPPLITARYRDQRRLLLMALILSVLMVPLGVFGGYFFGSVDRNLHKGLLELPEMPGFAGRLALLNGKRVQELTLHYVVPRSLCVIAVVLIASGISRRNTGMLERQAELSGAVRREMQRQNELQSRVIDAMAALIETRDEGTGEHVARTKRYVEMIARRMQLMPKYRGVLTDEAVEKIVAAAPLHDVGKISVSDRILLKPGKLTPEEFNEMKKHAPQGGRMIRRVLDGMDDEMFIRTAEEIAVSHHEKWDGTGYPRGLRGEEIPLSARIMAAADVFDALVSRRVYKEPIAPEAALAVIESESGTHFDPDVIEAVRSLHSEFIAQASAPEVCVSAEEEKHAGA